MGHDWRTTFTEKGREVPLAKGVRYREHATRKNGIKRDKFWGLRYTHEGKRFEENLGWETEGWTYSKAMLEMAKLKEAQKTGKGPVTVTAARDERRAVALEEERKSKTFAQLVDDYLVWAKNNIKTWKHNERRLRLHVSPHIGHKQMSQVSPADVELVKNRCQEKGLSPASINHCLQLIRGVYYWASSMDIYDGPNPARKGKVKFIKHDNKKVRFLSRDEASRLLTAIKERSSDWHDICYVSLYTGMRFGEIAGLSWSDIDFEHGQIHILDPKNGETRQAYLTEDLSALLSERKLSSVSSLIFPGRKGQVMDKVSRTFDRTVDAMGFNAGIDDPRKKITFHSLRHTFASWLALDATPIQMIQQLLGHKTLTMTLRYAHLMPDQKREAVERLSVKRDEPKPIRLIRSSGG